MPRISSFYGIIIYMYFKEHNPPHFHATYGEIEAEIAIDTLALLVGKLPPKAMGLVVEWASQHQEELMKNWNNLRKDGQWFAIEPLQ
ncbi:MAG: DUF4160 domain-containing protein [Bacteroidetes bacterium]|nr:DUF4160 domain-containing protein [Bacteroidota bacterium]